MGSPGGVSSAMRPNAADAAKPHRRTIPRASLGTPRVWSNLADPSRKPGPSSLGPPTVVIVVLRANRLGYPRFPWFGIVEFHAPYSWFSGALEEWPLIAPPREPRRRADGAAGILRGPTSA